MFYVLLNLRGETPHQTKVGPQGSPQANLIKLSTGLFGRLTTSYETSSPPTHDLWIRDIVPIVPTCTLTRTL